MHKYTNTQGEMRQTFSEANDTTDSDSVYYFGEIDRLDGDKQR